MIVSPCISICKTDPSTGYCYGCGRSNEEKRIWKLEETTEEWKNNNLEIIRKRLSGWQLDSFNESYDHKVNNGISLFKKNLKMSKSSIVIIIYIIGLIFGALVLDIWSAETSPKALLGIGWTALFLIGLFFADKNEKK